MRLVAIVLSLSILTPLGDRAARADDWPYPPGRSSPVIEGLTVELDLPRELSKDKPASMVVILHGAGGTATGMAGSLREWTGLGYVICAPKSTDQTWSAPDIQAVKRIAEHMKSVLPIDPAKVHVVGFSNGGWNLDPLAFDDTLRPCSATWIAAGCRTGSAPKWAKKGLGVLALAGTEDGNAKSAAETVKILDGKVRCVEARFQPGLGHAWPDKLEPYLKWWHGVMEGRFTPGYDMNFDWGDSIEAAVQSLADQKKGGVIVYAWAAEDQDKPHAKELSNEVLMDPLVRHYGNQLKAVLLDRSTCTDALTALGVTETPALVVLDKKGEVEKVLQGEKAFKTRSVASAFKSVAPNKKKPE